MSNASGDGAALDPAGMSVETDEHAALREELRRLTEDLTEDERRREARRVEIAHELYERDSRTPGTPAHAAHVAQLRRLRDGTRDAYDRSVEALAKAQEHVAGKEDAQRDAAAALEAAEAALADATGPDDDGNVVL